MPRISDLTLEELYALEKRTPAVVKAIKSKENSSIPVSPLKKSKPKISDLSLDELYAREKMTPAVVKAIKSKEDFSSIQPRYCEKVCSLNCKNFETVRLLDEQVDILIIDETSPPEEKYKNQKEVENTHMGVITYLANKYFDDLTWKVTKLVKCNTKGESLAQATAMKCSPYLDYEIVKSKPKVIISLTTPVTKALGLTKLSNTNDRGQIHNNVIITLHPKYTMMIRQNSSGKLWGPDYLEILDRDFSKAGRIAGGELIVPTLEEGIENVKKRITICESISEVREVCNEILSLPEGTVISFDLETNSLDPFATDSKILTAQFGYRKPDGQVYAYVITLYHRANLAYDPDEAWEYVKPILLKEDLPKVGHNIKFDNLFCSVTKKTRVKGITFDTMLLLHSLNSGLQKCYGLKMAVWDFLPEMGLGGYEDNLALPKEL